MAGLITIVEPPYPRRPKPDEPPTTPLLVAGTTG
jgi:hypothetical protein